MTHVVMISDTHGHIVPDMPPGDLLIHAGDLTNLGTVEEVSRQLEWLTEISIDYGAVVFIAGNHDFLFEKNPELARSLLEDHIYLTYLEDSFTTVNGLKIWGSPVTPHFNNWAFNRDDNIKNNWDIIHDDVDILITHGPPKYVLDSWEDQNIGDPHLARRVLEVSPKLHVFGHCHFPGGSVKSFPYARKGQSYAVNAAVCDSRNRLVGRPVELEI